MNVKSRTHNAVHTAFSSSMRVLISVFLTFFSRTLFIYYLGAEYLALNGLFTNVLSVLSLADLGIGSAIVFFLYKPIADNDNKKIAVLLHFYKRCYRLIGSIILCLGLLLIPFLKYLVNFDTDVDINLYAVYILFLLTSAASYLLFAYKQSLLMADQKGYVVENVTSVFSILNALSDLIILVFWRNYILYLVARLALVLIKNVVIGFIVDKSYTDLPKVNDSKLTQNEKNEFYHSLYNISIFNVGDRLINSTDNIIISAFLGTILVGYYSNYYMIIIQLRAGYSAIMKSFQAGIGNVIATNSSNKYQTYKRLSLINHFLGTLCTVELIQVFNSFIYIWIGKNNSSYLLSQTIVCIIALNFYYDNSTWILNMFREANGDFKVGRYISLIAGVVNIIVSIIFAIHWGLTGVLLGTIVAKYLVAVYPFVTGIGNKSLNGRGTQMLIEYWVHFGVMVFIALVSWFGCRWIHLNGTIAGFIAEGVLCAVIVSICFVFIYGRTDEFKYIASKIMTTLKRNNN